MTDSEKTANLDDVIERYLKRYPADTKRAFTTLYTFGTERAISIFTEALDRGLRIEIFPTGEIDGAEYRFVQHAASTDHEA